MRYKKGYIKGFKIVDGEELYKICSIGTKIEHIIKEHNNEKIEDIEYQKTNIKFWKNYFTPYEWSKNSLNAYLFNIDNSTYLCYEDLDDGYRSYSKCIEFPELKAYNNFPESIEIEYRKNFNKEKINEYKETITICYQLEVIKNNKEIITVYTDYSDTYYPTGIVRYCPENLEIKK